MVGCPRPDDGNAAVRSVPPCPNASRARLTCEGARIRGTPDCLVSDRRAYVTSAYLHVSAGPMLSRSLRPCSTTTCGLLKQPDKQNLTSSRNLSPRASSGPTISLKLLYMELEAKKAWLTQPGLSHFGKALGRRIAYETRLNPVFSNFYK